jgi:molecular chaperone DnaK
LKNEADSSIHNTEKSLNEHKSKLQQNDIEEIEKSVNDLRSLIAGNLTVSDIPRVKECIEACKQAAMKIGKVMYQGAGNQQQQQSSEQSTQQEDTENKENKDKKD